MTPISVLVLLRCSLPVFASDFHLTLPPYPRWEQTHIHMQNLEQVDISTFLAEHLSAEGMAFLRENPAFAAEAGLVLIGLSTEERLKEFILEEEGSLLQNMGDYTNLADALLQRLLAIGADVRALITQPYDKLAMIPAEPITSGEEEPAVEEVPTVEEAAKQLQEEILKAPLVSEEVPAAKEAPAAEEVPGAKSRPTLLRNDEFNACPLISSKLTGGYDLLQKILKAEKITLSAKPHKAPRGTFGRLKQLVMNRQSLVEHAGFASWKAQEKTAKGFHVGVNRDRLLKFLKGEFGKEGKLYTFCEALLWLYSNGVLKIIAKK